MLIFLTEYEEDGKSFGGPLIIAPNWKEAEEQALRCNITIVGSLDESTPYPAIAIEKRVIH
jgi:hypothetical protein|tara:strand:+ start:1846 stop:2028 length:183 start_codon:yes stop_codon:yes gene_type:complete